MLDLMAYASRSDSASRVSEVEGYVTEALEVLEKYLSDFEGGTDGLVLAELFDTQVSRLKLVTAGVLGTHFTELNVLVRQKYQPLLTMLIEYADAREAERKSLGGQAELDSTFGPILKSWVALLKGETS